MTIWWFGAASRHRLTNMNDHAKRLLKLQQEFAARDVRLSAAIELDDPSLNPRSEDAIAADYDSALREFMRPRAAAL